MRRALRRKAISWRWPAAASPSIIEGVDSLEAKASLYSTVHGAGRLLGCKEAKRRFARAEMDAWLQSRGVTVVDADLDESPMAYRRLQLVAWRNAQGPDT